MPSRANALFKFFTPPVLLRTEMKASLTFKVIVAFITTVFVFPNAVASIGGWYIDEETCSTDAIQLFQGHLKRSLFAHVNLATAFGSVMSEEI